jgi:hypothetical protein
METTTNANAAEKSNKIESNSTNVLAISNEN